MPDSVSLSLSNGELAVAVPQQYSNLFQGEARVFFRSILGFESDPPHRYWGRFGSASSRVFFDVVEFLENSQVPLSLDETLTAMRATKVRSVEELAIALKRSKELRRRPVAPAVVPPGFARELKPHQIGAVSFFHDVPNAANFSVPGSGKTTVTLAAFGLLKAEGVVDKVVVIGPRAAFQPWEQEYESSFGKPARVTRITGTRATRQRLFFEADGSDLVLLTYQMAANDEDPLSDFLRRNKVLLILDESHYVKRLEGGRWADAIINLAPLATRRMILSGTPAPNSLLDLWSQFTFLWPDQSLLGPTDQFRMSMAQKNSTEALRTQLHPLFWRTTKRELALPKPRFIRTRLRLKKTQQAIYDAIAAKVLKDVVKAPQAREQLREWRKARMVRLMQAASNPSLLMEFSTEFRIPPLSASGLPVDRLIQNYSTFETPVKVDYAVRLTNELVKEQRQKVLIWSSFVHNIRTLERLLDDLNPLVLFGEVPKDAEEDAEYNRERIISDFKTLPNRRVLIANPSACAESVSLHKVCSHAIYLDRTFNAAQFMQSMDRIHRVGLAPTDKVVYHILMAKDSIDEVIDDRLRAKQRMMRELLEGPLPVGELEAEESQVSEASEEEADFNAVIATLRERAEDHD